MLLTSDQDPSIQHKLNITNIYTIGDVDGNQNVVYEAILRINSSISFDHTYTKTEIRYPVQTGTETKVVEETVFDDPYVAPPVPQSVTEDGVVYYEASERIRYASIVEKEIEVPTYDIPEAINEDVEVTDTREFTESKSFSVEFSTENIENFVSFDQLTEDTIIGWIPESLINPQLSDNTEKLLTEKDKVLNPLKHEKKEVMILPWNIEPEEVQNTNILDPSSEG